MHLNPLQIIVAEEPFFRRPLNDKLTRQELTGQSSRPVFLASGKQLEPHRKWDFSCPGSKFFFKPSLSSNALPFSTKAFPSPTFETHQNKLSANFTSTNFHRNTESTTHHSVHIPRFHEKAMGMASHNHTLGTASPKAKPDKVSATSMGNASHNRRMGKASLERLPDRASVHL